MSRIRGRGTGPERVVRGLLRALRVRFRSNAGALPGNPDVVVPAKRCAVFVHGCFWHGHAGCKRATIPATRTAFWKKKIEGNRRRDGRVQSALRRLGWRVMVIWECRMGSPARLAARLKRFLRARR